MLRGARALAQPRQPNPAVSSSSMPRCHGLGCQRQRQRHTTTARGQVFSLHPRVRRAAVRLSRQQPASSVKTGSMKNDDCTHPTGLQYFRSTASPSRRRCAPTLDSCHRIKDSTIDLSPILQLLPRGTSGNRRTVALFERDRLSVIWRKIIARQLARGAAMPGVATKMPGCAEQPGRLL